MMLEILLAMQKLETIIDHLIQKASGFYEDPDELDFDKLEEFRYHLQRAKNFVKQYDLAMVHCKNIKIKYLELQKLTKTIHELKHKYPDVNLFQPIFKSDVDELEQFYENIINGTPRHANYNLDYKEDMEKKRLRFCVSEYNHWEKFMFQKMMKTIALQF